MAKQKRSEPAKAVERAMRKAWPALDVEHQDRPKKKRPKAAPKRKKK